ncbi:hypothetical protein GCM10027174_12900 [Salinifilum aidingensis]
MGVFDKAKEQAQQLVGKAKQATGQATGNEEMRDAGKRDEMGGKVKEAGQDIKDKAAGAAENVKDRFQGGQGDQQK